MISTSKQKKYERIKIFFCFVMFLFQDFQSFLIQFKAVKAEYIYFLDKS